MSQTPHPIEYVVRFIREMKPRQQMLLIGTALVVGATLWAFSGLLGKAEYKTVYADVAPVEAQNLAQRLQAKGIAFEIGADGRSLRVPADRLDEARLALASQGVPSTGRLGFELFDKPNWAGSTFSERVNFQRALESELERTIQTIQEVEAARVHLVLPRESLFTEREREGKAAVVVKLRGGRLAQESLYSIRNLVSSAVEQLKPENVTVVNAEGNTPLPAGGGLAIGADKDNSLEKALQEKILVTLAPVIGAEKVRATVTVEYDLSSSENMHETYDPNATVVTSSQSAEEQAGGPAPGGVPGTPSNVPGPGGAPASGVVQRAADTQSQKTESKTFAVSKTVRHVVEPAGRIKRIATAVLVDDGMETVDTNGQKVERPRKRTPEEMKQIEELGKAAIGFDTNRGDQFALQNLSFQSVAVEMPAPPAMPQRIMQMADRWIWLVRYVALGLLFLLVYFLILRPLKIQVITSFREMPQALAAVALPSAPSIAGTLGTEALFQNPQGLEIEGRVQQELSETDSDVKRAVMLKRHLVDKVKKEPIGASRLIQNWIRREGARR